MIKSIKDKYKVLPTPVKASLWFLFSALLQKGIVIISTPIFTRLLNASEYGHYAVFNSWLNIITIFISLGLYNSFYTRGLAIEKDVDAFSSSLLGLTTTIALLYMIVYSFTCDFWDRILSLESSQIYLMLVMILLSSSFSYWSVRERFLFHYKKVVFVSVLIALVKPILGIFFVLNSADKVTARIFAIALSEFFIFSMCYYSIMKSGMTFFKKEHWKSAIFFAVPLIPHYLSMSILNSSDKIMIEHMIDASSAGIYELAYAVAQVTLVFNAALNQTLDPMLYRYLQNQNFNSLRKTAYSSIILVATVNILLIAFAPEIVSIFAPPTYYEAIYIIPPVSIGMYFWFFYNFFSVFEFYWDKTVHVAIATTLGAALNMILNYIFIRIYGYYAAGYTTMFCYLLYVLFHYYFMRKICKEKYNDTIYSEKILIAITSVFVGISFVFLFLYKNTALRYVFLLMLLVFAFLNRKVIIQNIYLVLYNKRPFKRDKHIDRKYTKC